MRQQLREFSAALAVTGKLVRGAEHLGHAFDECEALLFVEGFRAVLAIELNQFWFVIKEIQLRRRASHVEVNGAFGLRREMRSFGGQRIVGRGSERRGEKFFVEE